MLSEASRIFFSNSREKNGLNAADRLRKYLAPFGVARATMRGRRSQLSLRVRACQKLNRVEDAAAPECRLGHPLALVIAFTLYVIERTRRCPRE